MHTHQNPKLGTIFTKIRQSNVDFLCALAFVLLAFAFNYGRLRTFLLAQQSALNHCVVAPKHTAKRIIFLTRICQTNEAR